MAKKFIKEIGDKNSKNVASTEGARVKTIAPAYYMTSDQYVEGDTNVKLIQGEIDKKQDTVSWDNKSGVATYNTNSNKAATVDSITKRIQELDVSTVGGDNKYIKSISETDGKISPVAGNIDSTVTENSSNPVSSGAVYNAIQSSSGSATMPELDLNADETICEIRQDNGFVTATKQAIQLTATFDQATRTLIFNNITFSTGIWPNRGNFGLAVYATDTTTDHYPTSSPNAAQFHGDREWVLDWRPYLVDMTPVSGQIKKTPVAELMKNNWLRKIDGTYAPVVGITSEQSIACDKANASTPKLYWKKTTSGQTVTVSEPLADTFYDGTTFKADTFWDYCKSNRTDAIATLSGTTYNNAIEIKLYDASGHEYSYGSYTQYHIVAPWETTETKYSIFIGRPDDCYLVDGVYCGTNINGRVTGITSKPVAVDGFDPSVYKLARTGITPGPICTVNNKSRSFFYNYKGIDAGCRGYEGNCGLLVNNGTYPKSNVSTYSFQTFARSNNADSNLSYPIAEGGYFPYSVFGAAMESGYGTKYLHNPLMFGSGMSSNNSPNSEATWKLYGGVRFADSATASTVNYNSWSAAIEFGDTSYNWYNIINGQYPHFQCLEAQIALSVAIECGISPDTEFVWNGGRWYYSVPTGVTGFNINSPLLGEMNARVYKIVSTNVTINNITKYVEFNMMCSLCQGMNLSGDIWTIMNGGCDLIYDKDLSGNINEEFLICPDQTKWLYTVSGNEIVDSGVLYPSETADGYIKVTPTGGISRPNTGWVISRHTYSPLGVVTGGSASGYDCFYQYTPESSGGVIDNGKRCLRRIVFRGTASIGFCSFRAVATSARPANGAIGVGGYAVCLLA